MPFARYFCLPLFIYFSMFVCGCFVISFVIVVRSFVITLFTSLLFLSYVYVFRTLFH